ncbi:hypothetical protein [Nocardia sp. NRRL S-836]|uniref:hypothetical protein n=1 Tax=Nocardia sp. NRRL S-836 TaxID=1519492 RepID=UPI0012FB6E93|nr:hypothetical protein [Nocardia sp. NRRL S-836]
MHTETRSVTIATAVIALVIAVGVNAVSAAIAPEWSRKNVLWLAVAVFVFAVGTALVLRRWRAGTSLAGARAVAAVDTGDGVLEVLQVSRSGSILVSGHAENGEWSAWNDLRAGGKAWDVAAVVPANDVVEYFVVDTEGVLRTARRDRGQLSAWHPVPIAGVRGQLVRIAATSLMPGHREVFAVTDGGRVLHAWKWDGTPWSAWSDAGLAGCIDVAACSQRDGVLDHFAVDRDGAVWQRWYADEQWHDWENWGRPGSAARAVSAYRKAGGFQEVVVAGKSGDLGNRWYSEEEGWSSWGVLDTPPAGLDDVAGGTTSAHHMHCVGVGKGGDLWSMSWSGWWSSWRAVPKA